MAGRSGRNKSWGGAEFVEKYKSEFNSWRAMKNRCASTRHADRRIYSLAGVSVCASWVESFPQFMLDMGPKPSSAHTIDRVDSKKGYSPENCVWATKKEQNLHLSKYRSNTTGKTGVYRVKSGKYAACIGVNGKQVSLGTFVKFEDAVDARRKAEKAYGFR